MYLFKNNILAIFVTKMLDHNNITEKNVIIYLNSRARQHGNFDLMIKL